MRLRGPPLYKKKYLDIHFMAALAAGIQSGFIVHYLFIIIRFFLLVLKAIKIFS